MSTVGQLIDDISFRMHSYTGIREKLTYLTAAVDSDDLTLTVADGSRVDRGLIQIDDELVMVENVQDDNTVTLFPFGRGREGTTAAAHTELSMVTNDPLLSNQAVLTAIQETVQEISPELFQVKSTTFDFEPAVVVYSLPVDCDRVLQVASDMPGVTKLWPRVTRWRFERSTDSTEFATGKALELYEPLVSGFSVRVTYAAPYTVPASRSDTLSSLGVQDSVREVIMLGSCWRLTQYMEAQRLQLQAVEQMARQEAVPAGASSNLAKYFLSAYQLRREQERRKLLDLNPVPTHRTR